MIVLEVYKKRKDGQEKGYQHISVYLWIETILIRLGRNDSNVIVIFSVLNYGSRDFFLAVRLFTPRTRPPGVKHFQMENRGCVVGLSWNPSERGHVSDMKDQPCFDFSCELTVFEEKCLASGPFVFRTCWCKCSFTSDVYRAVTE